MLLLIVPVTVDVSLTSMLITPLPPAPVNVLLVIVRLVVVSSCPLTTTPPARPAAELIVLFEKVSDKVPLALSGVGADLRRRTDDVRERRPGDRRGEVGGTARFEEDGAVGGRADDGRIAEQAAGDVERRRCRRREVDEVVGSVVEGHVVERRGAADIAQEQPVLVVGVAGVDDGDVGQRRRQRAGQADPVTGGVLDRAAAAIGVAVTVPGDDEVPRRARGVEDDAVGGAVGGDALERDVGGADVGGGDVEGGAGGGGDGVVGAGDGDRAAVVGVDAVGRWWCRCRGRRR